MRMLDAVAFMPAVSAVVTREVVVTSCKELGDGRDCFRRELVPSRFASG